MSEGQTAVIVSHLYTGHRLYYVRLIAEAAMLRGLRPVILLTSPGLESPEAALHLKGLTQFVDPCLDREANTVELARKAARRHIAAVTVFPEADRFLPRLVGWNAPGFLSVLIMRDAAQPGLKGSVSAWLKRRVSFILSHRRNVQVFTLKPATWTGVESTSTLRDPVDPAATASEVAALREAWGITPDRYWFGILGAVNSRKNVDKVLLSLESLKSPVGILIAGAIDPGTMRSILEAQATTQQVEIVTVNRLLTDEELRAAVGGVECLVLAHSNEGPSGLFARGLVAGTRIVASGAQSLRIDCEDFPHETQWVRLDIGELSGALYDASISPRPSPPISASRHFGDRLLGFDSKSLTERAD